MTKGSFVAAVGLVVAWAGACSSSSSGGGGSANTQPCGEPATNAACTSCENSNCAPFLATAENACSDFVACTCADGGSLTSCASKEQEGSCPSASMMLSSCIATHCASACTSSSNGDGGSTTSDSAATPTGSCATLATCCAMLSSADQTACTALAGSNVQTACTEQLAAFEDAGACQ